MHKPTRLPDHTLASSPQRLNIFGLGVNPDLGGHRISGTFTYNPAGATTQVCSPGGASECTNYFGVADTITAKIKGHTISETGVQLAELSLGANLPGSGEFSLHQTGPEQARQEGDRAGKPVISSIQPSI
jgi:hypothetical protein